MTGISKVILLFAFAAHDRALSFLARYMKTMKMIVLVVAHMSLFGIFFPELRKDFGELAANILIVILFLSPIAVITGMPLLRVAMGFRREFGILMGYLAIVHGAGYFLDPDYFDVLILPYLGSGLFAMEPRLLFGIVALILTFPLLFTSNTFSLRRLGGLKWKRLHFLVYPMFVFVVLHRFSGENGSEPLSGAFEAFLLIGSYALLKYLVWKPATLPGLREMIGIVGKKYGEFSRNTAS